MRTTLLTAASAAALVLTAGAAAAQEQTWDGLYIGTYAGVQGLTDSQDSERIQFDRDLNGSFNDTIVTGTGVNAFNPGFCDSRAGGPTGAQACSQERARPEYGLRIGYDRQFGGWVVGGVAEIGGSDVRDSVTAFSITPAYYTMNRRLSGLGAARLRVGYGTDGVLNRPILGYVTGGVAAGRVERSFATSNATNTFTERGDDGYAYGYQLGAGLETRVNSNVTVGLEYMYTTLNDDDYRVRVAGGAAGNPFLVGNAGGADFRRGNDDFNTHSLRVNLGYRF